MITKPKKVDKDWGFEIWLANNEKENYCGKILGIFEDKSTSMHYHVNKHETFYVLEGTLEVDMLADRDKQDQKTFSSLQRRRMHADGKRSSSQANRKRRTRYAYGDKYIS